MTLGTLHDARLRVAEPFELEITDDKYGFVAFAPEIGDYGFGPTGSEAIRDLQATIVELYFTLNEEADRLGPKMQATLATLQRKIQRVEPS